MDPRQARSGMRSRGRLEALRRAWQRAIADRDNSRLAMRVASAPDSRIMPFMPELPEVEVTRRSFADRIRGARVDGGARGQAAALAARRRARALVGADRRRGPRRGKYLWSPLRCRRRPADAPGHVGLAGVRAPPAGAPGRTTISTSSPTAARCALNDPRRFGAVVWSAAIDSGPAATAAARPRAPSRSTPRFAGALLTPRCARRRAPIKQVLLGGDIVVGAGNIYACEALFAGRHRPAHCAPTASAGRARRACSRRCARPWRGRSSSAARRCATSATRTAQPAHSRPRPRSTAAPASRACAVRRRRAAHRPGPARDLFLPGLPASMTAAYAMPARALVPDDDVRKTGPTPCPFVRSHHALDARP